LLLLDLPIAAGDSVSIGYGIWPYGVHGSAHALDGHPGFDFEYRPGAPVLAAAEGTVDNRIPDANDPTRVSLQLRHARSFGTYLTGYSNLASVPPELVPGASVTRGQILGTAGVFAGGQSGFTHFQFADPMQRAGSNPVSPADYFTPAGRERLDAIWRTASYITEFCEPFLTNVRANGFPMSRTWTSQTGAAIAQIVVRCPADGVDMEYTLIGADGSTLESGALTTGWWLRPTTADFKPARGSTRLALYDIVGGTVQLALGSPGGGRPSSLAAAVTYTTR